VIPVVADRITGALIQLDVHFIDAVQIGEFVEAKCRVVRRTRSLIFMSAELVVATRVVTTANGVWKSLGVNRRGIATPIDTTGCG